MAVGMSRILNGSGCLVRRGCYLLFSMFMSLRRWVDFCIQTEAGRNVVYAVYNKMQWSLSTLKGTDRKKTDQHTDTVFPQYMQ